jgi:acylpyruvate hydrolase
MKLATLCDLDGESTAAVDAGAGWRRLPARDLSAFLQRFPGHSAGELAGDPVVASRFLLPLPAPAKVICCGLNYADHIVETGRSIPEFPTLFAKYADTLTGPADTLSLPAGLDVDWEAELAVVIGGDLFAASRDEALEAVLGYTVANDVSVRNWQNRTVQWFQGKAWDRTTPVGPVVVTADELDPYAGLDVVTRVDGVERQRGNTETLVFGVAELVAYVSTFTRLRPGDLVLTGTPGGVGMAARPPSFLGHGALLETEVAGIGVLTNRVTFSGQ